MKILNKIADKMQSFDGFEVLALMAGMLFVLFFALVLLAFFL